MKNRICTITIYFLCLSAQVRSLKCYLCSNLDHDDCEGGRHMPKTWVKNCKNHASCFTTVVKTITGTLTHRGCFKKARKGGCDRSLLMSSCTRTCDTDFCNSNGSRRNHSITCVKKMIALLIILIVMFTP